MREKHTEKQCTEPWVKWERMRFPEIPVDLEKELKAEAETDEDLTKPIPQLVCDFNFEIQNLPFRADVERKLLTAQSRMVAMMARVAMKHEEVSDQILRLTHEITWLTRGIFLLSALTIVFIIFSYFHPGSPSQP